MNTKNPNSANPLLLYLGATLAVISVTIIGLLFSVNDIQEIGLTSLPSTHLSATTIPTLILQVEKEDNTSTTIQESPIRLVWFTSLPKNTEDILTVAKWFDVFILIQGDESNRDLIRSMGVDGPILQYLEFASIQDPGSCTDEPKINQVANKVGDFCMISQENPDWFLLDNRGKRIKVTDNGNTWYLMDPGNLDWRDFFIKRVREFQSDPNWNGVFLDNVPVTLVFLEDDGNLPASYPDDVSYRNAVQGFLQFLSEHYFRPEHKLLIPNLVSRRGTDNWIEQLNYVDGAMFEGWVIDWPDGYRPADVWEAHMNVAEQTQMDGKDIILVSQGNKEDTVLQNFAFASYLLINQGMASFRYANSSTYREIWLYDNYNINLGNPIGFRYKVGDEWRRDFANGYVRVNPVTHVADIKIK